MKQLQVLETRTYSVLSLLIMDLTNLELTSQAPLKAHLLVCLWI